MEKKIKLKQIFSKALCSVTAAAMTLTSFSGLANVAAADAVLDNNITVTHKNHQYPDAQSYVSKNVDTKVVKDMKGKSAKAIQKSLEETNYSIRLKHLIAEKSKIPKNCSIDTLWSQYSKAFIAQYTDTVPLYATSDDADYYVANLAAANVNGTGDIYDAAFVKGTNNKNPDVIKDIKFDKDTGLAYIPKSYFAGKATKITGQVMYAGSINNQDVDIDVTVNNPNNTSESVKEAVKASTYDVTVSVPITTSKKMADKLSLDDFQVFLNGSETEYDLKKENAAVFHKDTGVLELAVSPATLTSVKVGVKKEKITQKLARIFSVNVHAKTTNPDKLKFVTDKASGDPIILDKIDSSKLQDGQVFDYKSSVSYMSDVKGVYNGTVAGFDTAQKARAESILHSVKFLYLPVGSAESGWFDIYDKGSNFEDTDGVNTETSLEDVTFGMTLPSKTYTNYKVTALNKNKATLNFHQKGSFTTKYAGGDLSYSAQRMYAGECCHITNPMGSSNESPVKTRLSILHVDESEGYVIIGLNTQEMNTQSGFGIYKLAFESKGAVKVKKTSANTSITNGNKCYNLEGAEFGVYSDKACTKKVMTLTAKANGETDVKEIDAGTYYVKETKAPKGYELNSEVKTVVVDTDNDEDAPAVVTIADQPKDDPMRFEVKKVDKETGESQNQGDANLAGTQFTVKFYNNHYDDVSKLPSNATRTWVLETKKFGNKYKLEFSEQYKVSGDEFYKDSDGRPVVPYGTLTIEETKAPEGYKLEDSTVSVNETVLSNRKYFTKVSDKEGEQPSKVVADFTVSDPAKMYGIQVWKSDKELDKSEAIGGKGHTGSTDGTTLAGTQFNVINRSASSIRYKEKDIAPGEEIMKLTTKWDEKLKKYTAQTEEKALPYGTYGVKEIASSQGYLLTDGSEKTVVCHGEDGHMYTPAEIAVLNFKNQVIRGDYQFVKRDGDSQKYLSAAFKLTNTTTGESHVIVTDKNGEFDSTANKHSKNTNANDHLLDGYNDKTAINSDAFDLNAGTWFGKGEDGTVAKANDNLGALPYGKYELEELRTDTNKGLKLVKYEFYINKDGKKIDGGTVTDNEEKIPEIHTTAKDEASGTHFAAASDDASIIDTVTLKNLPIKENNKFKLTGVVMDRAAKTPVLDKNGKEITSVKEFTTDSDSGSVEVNFDFDATDLAGKDAVIFETLTQEQNGETVVIAVHKDFDDEGQTIHFPEIKTKASDGKTGLNMIQAGTDMFVIDTVSYKNLIPGKTYTIPGTLMDKETEKPALDDNGKEITSSAKFTAEKSEGSVTVAFKFSGVKLSGTTLVAFEKLVYKDRVYAVHEDITDEAQTVYVPEIHTTALEKDSKTHISYAGDKVIITDAVAYKNVIAGKEYTIPGKLMDHETQKTLLINGKEVTAEKTFTAENTEGTVDIEFTLDASALAGKTAVAFEQLYVDGVLIASHEDINSKEQSIHFPKIITTATDKEDGDHEAAADKSVTINDEIPYYNLIPGEEYEVICEPMIQDTEKPLTVDGKLITVTKKFTAKEANGTVNVSFTFDGTKLAEKDITCFETVMLNGRIVAEHKDIHSEAQTVHLVKPKEESTPVTPTPPGPGSSGVKTGQDSILPMAAGAAALIACAGGIIVWKKKSKKKDKPNV